MLNRWIASAFAAALLMAPVSADDADPVYDYSTDNAVMGKAQDDARATLDLFFDVYNDAEARGLNREHMLLKVAIPYGDPADGNLEVIWCHVLGFDGEKYVGLLSNKPAFIDFEQYDQVEWDHEQISDWMYFDTAGKMHGAYTIRVMLPDLDAETRAEYRAMLAPLPGN